jgi:hypothetical protein
MHKPKTKLHFLIIPTILALLSTSFWYLLHHQQIIPIAPDADIDYMSSGVISVLGIFYAVASGFIIATVWKQFVFVEEAIKVGSKEEFIRHKDKRIPNTIKIMFVIYSCILLLAFYMTHVSTSTIGIFSIFSITYCLVLNYQIMIDLDDPFSGLWIVDVPKQWKHLIKHERVSNFSKLFLNGATKNVLK